MLRIIVFCISYRNVLFFLFFSSCLLYSYFLSLRGIFERKSPQLAAASAAGFADLLSDVGNLVLQKNVAT